MNFSKFRFYTNNGASYLMESDLRKIIKNSKSIKFNKEKFDKYRSFIECATIGYDRHIKTLSNEKAFKFAKRLAKMYNLQWNDHRCIGVRIDGTAYEKRTYNQTVGISKYSDINETFAVVSIPVMKVDSRSYYRMRDVLDESCNYTCLRCGIEIEFEDFNYYTRVKSECTIYELMNDRLECLCSNCSNDNKREFVTVGEDNMPNFLRSIATS